MAYEYRYINKQEFPFGVGYTLLIDELDSDILYRIEKCFKMDLAQIDKEFLRTEAKKEIEKIKEQLLLEQDGQIEQIEQDNGDISE